MSLSDLFESAAVRYLATPSDQEEEDMAFLMGLVSGLAVGQSDGPALMKILSRHRPLGTPGTQWSWMHKLLIPNWPDDKLDLLATMLQNPDMPPDYKKAIKARLREADEKISQPGLTDDS